MSHITNRALALLFLFLPALALAQSNPPLSGISEGTPPSTAGPSSIIAGSGVTISPSSPCASGACTINSNSGPTVTTLTFSSATAPWGSPYFKSDQTFTGFKHLKVRSVLIRATTTVSLGFALSSDTVHAYQFSMQNDGNLIWYYLNGGSGTALHASGAGVSDHAGPQYIELDFFPWTSTTNQLAARLDEFYVTNSAFGSAYGQSGSSDNNIDLTTGTYNVWVNIDSLANVDAVYVESW